MTVPVTAEPAPFTPKALADIDTPPVFILETDTRSLKRRFNDLVRREGLVTHSQQQIREMTIVEMRHYFKSNTPDDMDAAIETMRQYWDAADGYLEAVKLWRELCDEIKAEDEKAELPPAPELDFDKDIARDCDIKTEQVMRISPVLKGMNADNAQWQSEVGRHKLRILLSSANIAGVDVPLSKANNIVDMESIDAIEDALEAEAEKHGVDLRIPFVQLMNASFLSGKLSEEQEKNSLSPPITNSKENGLTAAESKSDGSSKNG